MTTPIGEETWLVIKVHHLSRNLIAQVARLETIVGSLEQSYDGRCQAMRDCLKTNIPIIKAWCNEVRVRSIQDLSAVINAKDLVDVDRHLCKAHQKIDIAYWLDKTMEYAIVPHTTIQRLRKLGYVHILAIVLDRIAKGIRASCLALLRTRSTALSTRDLEFRRNDAPLEEIFLTAYNAIRYLELQSESKWSELSMSFRIWGQGCFYHPFTLDFFFVKSNFNPTLRMNILENLGMIMFYLEIELREFTSGYDEGKAHNQQQNVNGILNSSELFVFGVRFWATYMAHEYFQHIDETGETGKEWSPLNYIELGIEHLHRCILRISIQMTRFWQANPEVVRRAIQALEAKVPQSVSRYMLPDRQLGQPQLNLAD